MRGLIPSESVLLFAACILFTYGWLNWRADFRPFPFPRSSAMEHLDGHVSNINLELHLLVFMFVWDLIFLVLLVATCIVILWAQISFGLAKG